MADASAPLNPAPGKTFRKYWTATASVNKWLVQPQKQDLDVAYTTDDTDPVATHDHFRYRRGAPGLISAKVGQRVWLRTWQNLGGPAGRTVAAEA